MEFLPYPLQKLVYMLREPEGKDMSQKAKIDLGNEVEKEHAVFIFLINTDKLYHSI